MSTTVKLTYIPIFINCIKPWLRLGYKFCLLAILHFVQPIACLSQNTITYKWWNPAENNFPVVEGQAWPSETATPFDRFPTRAEKALNPNVWNISHSSAGLYIKFRTDASEIIVRYVVQNKAAFAMSHMPATGVSGIDLYAIDHSGNWAWAPGNFSFGDTIEYRFTNLEADPVFAGRDCEYRLFLPLYNALQWMQIGIPVAQHFAAMPLSPEKAVIVYGTSIAQGACATRPGLAWTAILQRKLDRPFINLGFSGSGKMEASVIGLMNKIDAKLYVLDCMPNLTASAGLPDGEAEKRIIAAVKLLQQKHPVTPILLVEHSSGGIPGIIDTAKKNEYEKVNTVLRKAFLKIKNEESKNIYLLSSKDINLDMDATVDGLHPNDIGMLKYANAYEKIIRDILQEPKGNISTTAAVIQNRDGYYNWRERHTEILKLNKKAPPQTVILANSIIHYWGGEPKAPLTRGAGSWTKYLAPLGMRNLGFGWDKIENVLWRVYHEELDGYDARNVIVMIGTNNLGDNTDVEIIAGLKNLVSQIAIRQPKATVSLSGLLPRRQMEQRIASLNKDIANLSTLLHVKYINPGAVLLNNKGKIDEFLFEDGLHPNAAGYEKLGLMLASYIKAK